MICIAIENCRLVFLEEINHPDKLLQKAAYNKEKELYV